MFEISGKSCGGKEAVEFFISLKEDGCIPPELEEKYEESLNRIKYEIAKGIGKKKKVTKAMKSWHRDMLNCGKCGFSANEPVWEFCPKCGTYYID